MRWAIPQGVISAQAQDLDGADTLLPGIGDDTIIADKAFDADERMIQP